MRSLALAVAVALLGCGLLMLVLFAADVGGWTRFVIAVVLTGIGASFLLHELFVEPEQSERNLR